MTLNGCAALGDRDFNLKVAVSRKRCIGPRLQLITNRKSPMGFPLRPRSMTLDDLEQLYHPRGRDFNLKVAISRKRCEIGPRLQLITNRKSYTDFDWHRKQWPWMTLSTKIEFFFTDFTFNICSQWAFIHALLSRVPFTLAGLSC